MNLYLKQLTLVALLGTFAFIGNAQADQPHMQNALDNLRAARHQLEIARADKDGHRVKAIEIIDEAISEVKAGMAAAD